MSTPTPGPWYLIETEGADFTAIATKPEIERSIDFEAEVLGSSEWLRAKPEDLRLMTAAPKLLAALQDLVQQTKNCDGTAQMSTEDAEAAIRDALGAA